MLWMIAAVVIVLVAILFFVKAGKSSVEATQKAVETELCVYPYRKMDSLFTAAERSFLGVLMGVVDDDISVFGKIRVADVIDTEKGLKPSERRKAFNKISSKHFDFVLCSKSDLSFLCVIELNDRSHGTKKGWKGMLFWKVLVSQPAFL